METLVQSDAVVAAVHEVVAERGCAFARVGGEVQNPLVGEDNELTRCFAAVAHTVELDGLVAVLVLEVVELIQYGQPRDGVDLLLAVDLEVLNTFDAGPCNERREVGRGDESLAFGGRVERARDERNVHIACGGVVEDSGYAIDREPVPDDFGSELAHRNGERTCLDHVVIPAHGFGSSFRHGNRFPSFRKVRFPNA